MSVSSSRGRSRMSAQSGAMHSERRGALSFTLEKFMKSKQQQLAVELPRHRQQDLEREQCLHRTEGTRHGSEDSRFGAVADDAVRRRLGPQAAQTRMRRLRLVHLQLSLVLIDAREHRRPPRKHGCVVDEELGAKIVAAVDDDVVIADEFEGIGSGEASGMGLDAARWD